MRLNAIVHEPEGAETQPPLVIAHGLFGSARNWGAVAKRLAEGRRVIAVDMRNHGDSPWSDDHSYPAMAGDLEEALETHGAGEAGPTIIIPHSGTIRTTRPLSPM